MFDGLDGLAHVFDGLAHVFDGQLGSAADTREEFLYRAALQGVLPPAVGPRLRGVHLLGAAWGAKQRCHRRRHSLC